MNKLLFIISPGTGILDNSAYLISKLKNKNQYYFLSLFLSISTLIKTVEIFPNKFFDEIILKINDDNFYLVSYFKIKFISKAIKSSFIFRILNYLFILFKLKKFIELADYYYYYKINKFIKKKCKKIDRKIFFKKINLVIYDCSEERKKYFSSISKLIRDHHKISLYHGSLFPELNQKLLKIYDNKKKYNIKKLNIICFSKKNSEKNFYKSFIKIKNINFYQYGNPKHSYNYNKVLDNTKKKNIILVSRHPDPCYFAINQKINFLKIIKKIIVDKFNFNLIVKLHPKENINFSKNIYFNIFGLESYKRNWRFSINDPMLEKDKCLFGISFFSGLSVDWSSTGFPSIELSDILTMNKKSKLLFSRENPPTFCTNKNGKIFFNTVQNGFTLHASNANEFLNISLKLMKNIEFYSKKIKKNYQNICPDKSKSIKKIFKLIDVCLTTN